MNSSVSTLLVVSCLLSHGARPAAADQANLSWVGAGHIGVNDIALSPDQSTLATASATDNTAKLWHAADGTFVRTLPEHLAGIYSCAFSPDGGMLATAGDVNFGSDDVQVKLWDVASGTVIRTFASPLQTTYSVRFSPDGTMLAAGQGEDVTIWRVSDGTVLRTLTGHTFTVFAVAWSPNGQMIASGSGDQTVKLWNATTGSLIRTLTGHTSFVNGLVFAPDGQTVASASWDQTARIWQVSNGALLHTLAGSTDALYTVAYSPDGTRIATAGTDLIVRVYDPATGGLVLPFTAAGVAGGINSLVFSSDGQALWSGSYDSHARRWRVSTGALELVVGHHTAMVGSIVFSADGERVATGSHDVTGHIWETDTGADLHALIGHNDVVNRIAWSEDMTQVATAAGSPPPDTRDTSIKIWNPATGALIRTLSGHRFGSTAVDYTPDHQFLISGGRDNQVKYWRQSDGAVQRHLFLSGPVNALQISPDGKVLAVAVGTRVLTFDVATGAGPLNTLTAPNQIVALDWSPDDSTVAVALSGYGHNVQIWDTRHATLVRTLDGDPNGFEQAVAFTPDGATLYTGSGYTYSIQVWRVNDGALLATYDHEVGWGQFPTLSIDVAPDGRTFAYGRNDATVVLAANPFVTAVDPAVARESGRRLVIAPNPLSGTGRLAFALRRLSRVEITVLDLGGRAVRRLGGGIFAAGPHQFAWDRTDAGGRSVPAGLYVVELRVDGSLWSRGKVAVLR